MKIIKNEIHKRYSDYWYVTIEWGWFLRFILRKRITEYGSKYGIEWFDLASGKPAFIMGNYLYIHLFLPRKRQKIIKKLLEHKE